MANGEWLLRHGTLPTFDPFLPMTDGLPGYQLTWLADATLAALGRQGLQWVVTCSAGLLLLSFALLARCLWVNVRHHSQVLVGLGVVLMSSGE